MPNQQIEAIGTHGQEPYKDVLHRRKAKVFKSGHHPFCAVHRTHFCPCTGALRYNDVKATTLLWDKAEEEYRGKRRSIQTSERRVREGDGALS